MNSVNWAGEAASHHVCFKLTWESPNEKEISDVVTIKIGDENIHTGLQVAVELERLWKYANRKGPYAIRTGTSVGFTANVSEVHLSDDHGVTWKCVPGNGAAILVPGNDGLAVWRS